MRLNVAHGGSFREEEVLNRWRTFVRPQLAGLSDSCRRHVVTISGGADAINCGPPGTPQGGSQLAATADGSDVTYTYTPDNLPLRTTYASGKWKVDIILNGMPSERLWYTICAMKKAIITVVGRDTVGILARVCTFLASNQVNILDISQTVVQDYFNMMMIADTAKSSTPFADLVGGLDGIGKEMGLQIKCQKSEIFEKMHRI